MNYKNLQTNADEPETFSAADEKVSALLGELNRVEAPNDFDFRVRTRIAQRSPRDFRPQFLPVLRYVLPLAAVLIILTGFVFNGFYNGDSANNGVVAVVNTPPPITENQSVLPNSTESKPSIFTASASEKSVPTSAPGAATAPVKNRTISASNTARQVASKKFVATSDAKISTENFTTGGGTRFSALTQPKRVITPPGISLGKTVGDATKFVVTKSLSAREILRQIGIEASYQNENWKVSAVQENSPAKRSDIKIGDAVEAIDGEKLTDKPLPTRTIEGKKLTILRGAQRIEISLGIKTN